MITHIEKVSLEKIKTNYSNFIIADLRGRQSYDSAHIEQSLCFQNNMQIMEFLKNNSIERPLLLLCFAKQRSKKMAQELFESPLFKSVYSFDTLYYFDAGFLELKDSAIPIVESPPPLARYCS